MSHFKNIFAAAALLLLTTPAFADLASDKAAVDAAKAAGTVGEQADGQGQQEDRPDHEKPVSSCDRPPTELAAERRQKTQR